MNQTKSCKHLITLAQNFFVQAFLGIDILSVEFHSANKNLISDRTENWNSILYATKAVPNAGQYLSRELGLTKFNLIMSHEAIFNSYAATKRYSCFFENETPTPYRFYPNN